MHIPVVTNDAGQKLSKQAGAQAVDLDQPVQNLFKALFFLGQNPPNELTKTTLDKLWNWAVTNWEPQILENQRSAPERSII